MTPASPPSESAGARALVPSPGRRGLGAIAAPAASGRGHGQSEGLARSFGMLGFAVSWPVTAAGAAAVVFLLFGFPQCRVRGHDVSPPAERPPFTVRLPDATVSPSVYRLITLRKPLPHFKSQRRDLLVHAFAIFPVPTMFIAFALVRAPQMRTRPRIHRAYPPAGHRFTDVLHTSSTCLGTGILARPRPRDSPVKSAKRTAYNEAPGGVPECRPHRGQSERS